MPSSKNLMALSERRREVGLTLQDMAARCGLTGRRSYQTAGAWERGQITPGQQRRTKFVGYLWDNLRLKEDPKRFWQIWEILVREWHWAPISVEEASQWRLGTSQEDFLSQSVTQLPIVIEMSEFIQAIKEKYRTTGHHNRGINLHISINVEVYPQL